MPTTPGKTIRVLFVCLGNICRSPMAEAILRHQITQAGLTRHIYVDSAGTGAYHVGEPPHQGTRRVLQTHGLSTPHRARVISADDFTHFDYIVALDRDNLYDLRTRSNGITARLGLLLDYIPALGLRDVPDPYYTGRFEEVYDLIEQACRALLNQIIIDTGIHKTTPT